MTGTIYDQYEYQGKGVWDGPSGMVFKHGRSVYCASPDAVDHPIYTDPDNNPINFDSFEAAVAAIEFPAEGPEKEEP